ERRDEIPPLTEFFLARYARRYNRPLRPLSDELRQRFLSYEWPGNVRELENMIKRIVVLQDESLVVQDIARGRTSVVPGAPVPVGHPAPASAAPADAPAAATPIATPGVPFPGALIA